MKLYEVELARRYYVTDTFFVTGNTPQEAIEKAEELSGNKDYTGKLQLEDVELMTVEEIEELES